MNSLRTQWLCEGPIFYAKRCRGGTEVSVKVTCDKKKKDRLERALEAKERRRRKKGKKEELGE